MKKYLLKLRIKWEGSLVKKNMVLKQEIKHLKKLLVETQEQNHKLIDQKTIDNILIRQLKLEAKNE